MALADLGRGGQGRPSWPNFLYFYEVFEIFCRIIGWQPTLGLVPRPGIRFWIRREAGSSRVRWRVTSISLPIPPTPLENEYSLTKTTFPTLLLILSNEIHKLKICQGGNRRK